MRICYISDDPAIRFAAGELKRYLQIAASLELEVLSVSSIDSKDDFFILGTFGSLGLKYPDLQNPELDDSISIEVDGYSGHIAGSNPRSVLIAVYRYLTELGLRWVRPGKDGEYLPEINLENTHVEVNETASYRHRGICIEGAVSYEHVRDIIDWSIKVGFNSYMIQFREAYTFFDRWYSHRNNPLKDPEPFDVEKAREYKSMLAEDMTRRGVVFHDVGHGWTCEPFGISGLGWEYDAPDVPENAVPYLAEINGERKLWYGVPLNTNLCYSNPAVREIIVQDIIGYSKQHPEVDVIHFWLADGANNHCECKDCVEKIPADWYVIMLNELDSAMNDAKLNARIVFLIYVDLLWPPQTEKIRNQERFILMFAPITRTYSKAFTTDAIMPDLPDYQRNKLQFPNDVEGNLAFLKAWQDTFNGDSFDFDYHLMWDSVKDPGGFAHADVIHADMVNLQDIGLNGLVSCQAQRVFFPTGLAMTVMGRTLWDRTLSLDVIVDDYFKAAFGDDGNMVSVYLQKLTEMFDPIYLRSEKPAVSEDNAAKFSQIEDLIKGFQYVIERNISVENPCHRRSWHYLKEHAQIYLPLSKALRKRATGDFDGAQSDWESVRLLIQQNEDDLHNVLDVFWTVHMLDAFFAIRE